MTTVLGLPVRFVDNATTMAQATNLQLLVAVSNILTWLIVVLCLRLEALESRRLEASKTPLPAVQAVENHEIEDEADAAVNFAIIQQAAAVENDIEEEETGAFEIVPEQRPVQRHVWNETVEDDLREALEDELAAQGDGEVESDRSDIGDDSDIVIVPAGGYSW